MIECTRTARSRVARGRDALDEVLHGRGSQRHESLFSRSPATLQLIGDQSLGLEHGLNQRPYWMLLALGRMPLPR